MNETATAIVSCECGCGCGDALAYGPGGTRCDDCDVVVCTECVKYNEEEDEFSCHECEGG